MNTSPARRGSGPSPAESSAGVRCRGSPARPGKRHTRRRRPRRRNRPAGGPARARRAGTWRVAPRRSDRGGAGELGRARGIAIARDAPAGTARPRTAFTNQRPSDSGSDKRSPHPGNAAGSRGAMPRPNRGPFGWRYDRTVSSSWCRRTSWRSIVCSDAWRGSIVRATGPSRAARPESRPLPAHPVRLGRTRLRSCVDSVAARARRCEKPRASREVGTPIVSPSCCRAGEHVRIRRGRDRNRACGRLGAGVVMLRPVARPGNPSPAPKTKRPAPRGTGLSIPAGDGPGYAWASSAWTFTLALPTTSECSFTGTSNSPTRLDGLGQVDGAAVDLQAAGGQGLGHVEGGDRAVQLVLLAHLALQGDGRLGEPLGDCLGAGLELGGLGGGHATSGARARGRSWGWPARPGRAAGGSSGRSRASPRRARRPCRGSPRLHGG